MCSGVAGQEVRYQSQAYSLEPGTAATPVSSLLPVQNSKQLCRCLIMLYPQQRVKLYSKFATEQGGRDVRDWTLCIGLRLFEPLHHHISAV